MQTQYREVPCPCTRHLYFSMSTSSWLIRAGWSCQFGSRRLLLACVVYPLCSTGTTLLLYCTHLQRNTPRFPPQHATKPPTILQVPTGRHASSPPWRPTYQHDVVKIIPLSPTGFLYRSPPPYSMPRRGLAFTVMYSHRPSRSSQGGNSADLISDIMPFSLPCVEC